MKREMPILFFVNCERTILFSVKRDLDALYDPLCIDMIPGMLHFADGRFQEMPNNS